MLSAANRLPPDPTGDRAHIRLLDNHTVNQIAAGEVVERPASAVKELVENALDAGATRVTVRLEDAGRSLIEVSDNGFGMPAEEAPNALLRHATSKIGHADDLLVISSYGFRGEALPSIASVSRMTLSTAERDGARTVVRVEEGTILKPTREPGPRGTTVRVEGLFAAIPARLKFLKTDATELSACVEAVNRFAVLRPDVAFTVEHHGSVVLRTSGTGDPLAALADVWGAETARALAPVEFTNGYASVRGFVSPPHLTKPTRTMQWLFVNGRAIKSRTLSAAIDQAYRSLTPERRYPVAVLMIELSPAELDINVSPTKSEVKFHREGGVFDAVRRGIREALLAEGMIPSIGQVEAANAAIRAAMAVAAPASWPAIGPAPAGDMAPRDPAFDFHNGGTPAESGADEWEQAVRPDLLDGLRVLGQIDNTFILAENRTSMLVIDQHVAHERILYEMLVRTRGSATVESQALAVAETLTVPRHALAAISERREDLASLGYDIEPFGQDSILIRAVPALGRGRGALEILRDIIDEIAEGGPGLRTPSRDEVYIMCSCKMAIKAGDPLGHAEMIKLIEDLAETENPYLCPHGRPITIVWPKSDLRRRFKR